MRKHHRLAVIILAAISWLIALPAAAQSPAGALRLGAPDMTRFPLVRIPLDVRANDGSMLDGLQASGLHVLENGQRIPVATVESTHPGAQVVLALNAGPAFAIRDANGRSRLDLIQAHLLNWLQSPLTTTEQTNPDDLSAVTNDGISLLHQSDPGQLATLIERYAPDARNLEAGIDVLTRAIDAAGDSTPRTGMGRVVIFITPPVNQPLGGGIQTLISLAQQQDVHVHVWMVASTGLFDSPAAQQIYDIALATGGSIAQFSGTESLPDLEALLEPNRSAYLLEYTSQIRGAGPHTLQVSLDSPQGEVLSEPRSLDFTVLPPNPLFIAPALTIERQPDLNIPADAEERWLPESQTFKMLVEFPDGLQRQITSSQLWVNGQLITEHTEPPFDSFEWDLTNQAQPGENRLQIVVTDEYGLQGSSIETLVTVAIQPAPFRLDRWVNDHANALVFSGAALLAGLVLWILVLTGRLRPQTAWAMFGHGAVKRPTPAEASQASQLQRAAAALPEAQVENTWLERLRLPGRKPATPSVLAYLERLPEQRADETNGLPRSATAVLIPVQDEEVIIGSSAAKAGLVLEDASVAAQHAILRKLPDGSFTIVDQGTVAGTWVNFSRLNGQEVTLIPGDRVHIGRVALRFRQNDPSRRRTIQIEALEEGA